MPGINIPTKKFEVICGSHGARTLTHHFFNDQWLGSEVCDLCREERDKQEQEKKAKRKQELAFAAREAELQNMIGRAGIPPRYLQKGFEQYSAKSEEQRRIFGICKDYATEFLQHEKSGKSLILLGTVGTGKTHLACSIANFIIMQHRKTALFMKVAEMMMIVKGTYSNSSQISTKQALQQFTAPDLLILDEVGVQAGTETERHIMLQVIDSRYDLCKPTVLTANLGVDQLKTFITPQGIDRLSESGGGLLVFNWESARPTLTPIAAH
jgi:DNA replication protein DnaC